jgi:hypothetical protein
VDGADGSQPGDLVHLDGAMPPTQYPKVIKSDDWKKIVPGLVVAAGGKVGQQIAADNHI